MCSLLMRIVSAGWCD
ncbi:hypothetical protein MMF84_004327 [Escherichia coli]